MPPVLEKWTHFDCREGNCQDSSVAQCDGAIWEGPVVKRRIGLALLASVLVVSGCSAEADPTEDQGAQVLIDGCAPGGVGVEAVSVSGAFRSEPQVAFEAPLATAQTQRLVVIEGSGEVVEDGDQVVIDISFHNASTGENLGNSGFDALSPVVYSVLAEDPLFEGVATTLLCTTVGSRVVGLIPATQLLGNSGQPEFGLALTDSIVAVFDVVTIQPPPEAPLAQLDGEPREVSEGFPTITYEESGNPVLTIPEGDQPTEFALDVLIEGSGQRIEPWSEVILHYNGVNWSTGDSFDSSWDRGEGPAIVSPRGVIPGFRDGLIGQTVGSRVVIIIPAELGYGPSDGIPQKGVSPTDTIVFVVDILGIR